MSSCRDFALAVGAAAGVAFVSTAALAQGAAHPGIGRAATPKELAAWDIDVRPDFKGLPAGSASVANGQVVWETKCASCHGVFGESGEVFNPLVGGATQDDVKTGRVARLTDGAYPGRTTLMKLSSVSTLWDYINRAMPWTQPKSLSVEEVYGVTAYMLNMGGILPDDFVMSDRNIAEVQRRLPNRNGMSTRHAMWPGKELGGLAKPDVQGSTCMSGCAGELKIASLLPDFARDAHGNLAEQNRGVGAQRGADTTRPGTASAPKVTNPISTAAPAAPTAEPAAADAKTAIALTQKHTCVACHGMDNKIVGPGFREIAKKYSGRADATRYLSGKIRSGGSGAWGAIPMPAQNLPEADAVAIAQWLAAGAAK